jgi:hypothetical protein
MRLARSASHLATWQQIVAYGEQRGAGATGGWFSCRPGFTVRLVTQLIQSDMPQPGLTPLELGQDVIARIERANQYARSRKGRYRRRSAIVKVSALAMSATSTIILGWQDLDFWSGLAFSLVALTTIVNALEPFFAWRSRWVLMEETQYRLYRLRDELSYYLASHQPDELDVTRINQMFDQYQRIWDQLGDRWLEYRRTAVPSW